VDPHRAGAIGGPLSADEGQVKRSEARVRPAQLPPARTSPARRRTFPRRLLAWYRRHRRDLPSRRTRNPYHILVSEIMLQQTQVDRVVTNYRPWLARYPSLAALARAGARQARPPRGNAYAFSQALMEFGATVCSARRPRCPGCPLSRLCVSYPLADASATRSGGPSA